MSAAVSTTVPVAVAPGDGNTTETNESSDDSFSLKYHVSSLNTAICIYSTRQKNVSNIVQ